LAVEADGSLRWRRALPDGVGDLAIVPGLSAPAALRLVVAAGETGLVVLDAAGRVVASGRTERAARHVVMVGGQAVTAVCGGTLEAFAVP
jgi:hypothetical protein